MTHIPVSPFFPSLHNFSPPSLFLSFFFFFFLSFPFFFIKPPCAICSRLRRHEKQQPAVTLRYYVAVQTAQWQTSACHPALSPQSPPRVTCRANARGWEAAFLRSHTNEHDSLVRTPLVYTTAIWKIICHAGGDAGICGAADSPGVARTPL